MSLVLAGVISRYYRFYTRYAADAWNNMTPMQYGTVLILVAAFGWILMKSGKR
jgi:hypothetical protein